MKYIFTFLFCIPTLLFGQDLYHTELLSFLNSEYDLENGEFVVDNQELQNINEMYTYGNVIRNSEVAPDQAFEYKIHYTVGTAGNNVWDAGSAFRNNVIINNGDIVLISFWGRKISANTELFFFAEHASTFEKETYFSFELSQDWTQYFVPFEASQSYGVDGISMGFHLAALAQEFEIAGYTAINFGDTYDLSDFPSSGGGSNYGGSEEDAPWRALAASRISNIRKADIKVIVKNDFGQLLKDVEVKVEMEKHAFGFGTALVPCRFPGNRCYDGTYVSKVADLDGQGHGFNVAVTENALKWDGWEEEWIGTPEETVDAIQWLDNNGIEVRGHTLIWPGWQLMPDDIFANRTNLDYIKGRIFDRISTMVEHPVLSQIITEWDVINEFTVNRDLENAFVTSPDYTTGREIYQEIFNKVEELAPNHVNYMNDYVVLSGGGSGATIVNRYKTFLDELNDSGVKFDGIGFQAHIGSVPTSINKIESTLDEFYQRYGKRMKITEYDINPSVDELTQAKYLEDFLTIIFSHPGVDAFLMWGFWDGNHWKGNAPIFNLDWSLKPSGQSFFNKVFNEWWTDESTVTSANGEATVNVFKGQHKVTVSKDGVSTTVDADFTEDGDLELVLDGVTSLEKVDPSIFKIFPNPINNEFKLEFPEDQSDVNLIIYNLMGEEISVINDVKSGEMISIDLLPANYVIKIQTSTSVATKKIVVLR
jgi:GH35 family endo-1,4-beta-xylanase